jgi:tetratricopeptide (TPR) repeat protein
VSDSTSTAKRRGMEARRLVTLLRGELDWVVMKCLEKDRTRRYETANGLARDIQRHLNNEPITARPPSAAYRFRKAVRRNKLAFGAAAAVVLALLLGIIATGWGLSWALRERATAEQERATAERERATAERQRALADDNFREARAAVEDLLRISDERLKDRAGLQPLRTELMKAAIDRYEPFLLQPIPDPTPRAELARLYARYGMMLLERTEVFDQSVLEQFEKARKLQEQLLQEHPGDRMLRENLGWTRILEEWRPHTMPPTPEQAGRQAIEIFRSLVAENPGDPFLRDDLVWSLWRIGRYVDLAEGLSTVNESIALGEQLVREYPASAEFRRELANALNVKSHALLGRQPTPQSAAAAIPFCAQSLELHKAIWVDMKAGRPAIYQPERPEGDEARMVSISPMWAEFDIALHSEFLADLYKAQGDWPHAAEMYDQAAQYYKDLVEHNPTVANFTGDLVVVFNARIGAAKHENDRRKAAAWSKDAVAFWNRQLDLHPDVPALKGYADDATKADAEVAKWLAQSESKQSKSSQP